MLRRKEQVCVVAGKALLDGELTVPDNATGLVLFAHGSSSGRRSPGNRLVAGLLNKAGLSTLLVDLLAINEEQCDQATARFRFNIELLADRLVGATTWLSRQPITSSLTIGYLGADTAAAATLLAAATQPERVAAIVSLGGRPDLAGEALRQVRAPTLVVVGDADPVVLKLNEVALDALPCEKKLCAVSDATHLVQDPGTLEQVAALARDWFLRYLPRASVYTPPTFRSDQALSASIGQALDAERLRLPDGVALQVANGWISLDGPAADRGTWDEVVRVVAGLPGVMGVDDRVAGRVVTRVR
jgi:predicted alpha/beta-hydrolase family hydrolase